MAQTRREFLKKAGMGLAAAAVTPDIIMNARIPLQEEKPADPDATPEFLPEWEKGYLYIHSIGTGQGDCTVMVMPDGTTWMVDAGDIGSTKKGSWWHPVPDNKKSVGEHIADYYNHFSPTPGELDYFSLTHFHADHIGNMRNALPGPNGYKLSGISMVAEHVNIHKMVDRDYPDYSFPSHEMILKECGFFPEYRKFIDYQRSKGVDIEKFKVGTNKQFVLLHDPKPYAGKFEVRNITGNAEVWTGKGSGTRKMYSGDINLFDENMNSCGFLLRYGDFVYYNAGDLSSGNIKNFKSQERDFEKYVAKFCGHVTLVKPDHHGWKESTNAEFLLAARPEVFVTMASHEVHPYVNTIRRMSDPLVYPEPREFYSTTDAPRQKMGEDLWSLYKPTGHIVVRVHPDGRHYEVFVLDIFSGDYRIKYRSELKEVRVQKA